LSLFSFCSSLLSFPSGIVFQTPQCGYICTPMLVDRYPSDGGTFANIRWENARISGFYCYQDEPKEGRIFDFESQDRGGLSQLINVTAHNVVARGMGGSSFLKEVVGAPIQNVAVSNLALFPGVPLKEVEKEVSEDAIGAFSTGDYGRDDSSSMQHNGDGEGKPFLFECKSNITSFQICNLTVDWGANEALWSGVQAVEGSCVNITSVC
jgi:hypothetical protein